MYWESENICFGEIGDPIRPWHTGYQKRNLVQRANAFAHILTPIFLKKIRRCQNMGYYNLAGIHLETYKSKFKTFLEIVIKAENAKSYYIMQETLLSFLRKLGVKEKYHASDERGFDEIKLLDKQ